MDSGEEKNILPFPGIETSLLNLLARNNVVMSQLQKYGSIAKSWHKSCSTRVNKRYILLVTDYAFRPTIMRGIACCKLHASKDGIIIKNILVLLI